MELNRFILRTMSVGLELMAFDDGVERSQAARVPSVLQQFDVRSLLALPLLYKSRMTGLIVVHRCKSPIQWSEQARIIFSSVSGHLGVAIHNAELFSAVQTRAITQIN